MAGVGDDVDEGWLVVLLRNSGVVHALRHEGPGLHRADGQAHRQPDPLLGDGPLQEDGFPVEGVFTGDNDVGQVLHSGEAAVLIGHPCHLGKYFLTDIRNQGWDAAHKGYLLRFYSDV